MCASCVCHRLNQHQIPPKAHFLFGGETKGVRKKYSKQTKVVEKGGSSSRTGQTEIVDQLLFGLCVYMSLSMCLGDRKPETLMSSDKDEKGLTQYLNNARFSGHFEWGGNRWVHLSSSSTITTTTRRYYSVQTGQSFWWWSWGHPTPWTKMTTILGCRWNSNRHSFIHSSGYYSHPFRMSVCIPHRLFTYFSSFKHKKI